MSTELPQPTFELNTPAAGWWKAPSALGTDPVFLRVEDRHRLASIGLYVASIGWALNHAAKNGWIPEPAVTGGQLTAAPRDQLVEVAEALVAAGIWARCELDGMAGFVIAGASKAVEERFARQNSASKAGKASAQSGSQKAPTSKYPTRPVTPDPNKYVDWSKESGEL